MEGGLLTVAVAFQDLLADGFFDIDDDVHLLVRNQILMVPEWIDDVVTSPLIELPGTGLLGSC